MTTSRNLSVAGLVAGGLALTTLALPATSSTADPDGSTAPIEPTVLTFTLAGRDSEQTFVDERRRGESVGDRHYSAATVRSGGQVAGRLQGECAVLDSTFEGHLCHLVLVLEDGQLTFTAGGLRRRVGEVRPTGDVFAVTGGTGVYQGVGGELGVGEDGRTLTVTLVED